MKSTRPVALLLVLGALSACGGPEFPPTEETVQAAAEELGWTLDPEVQREGEERVTYTLETGKQDKVWAMCALADGEPVLRENCLITFLPEKPRFAWEDWRETVTLAESLYGLERGTLYQAMTRQPTPEAVPVEDPGAPEGQEAMDWEVDLPSAYGRVRWLIGTGSAEQAFPESTVRNWALSFSLTLYPSREVFAHAGAAWG